MVPMYTLPPLGRLAHTPIILVASSQYFVLPPSKLTCMWVVLRSAAMDASLAAAAASGMRLSATFVRDGTPTPKKRLNRLSNAGCAVWRKCGGGEGGAGTR
jgi:hypothetical protein